MVNLTGNVSRRYTRLLAGMPGLLLGNGIPLLGVFLLGWSVHLLVMLYWLECLVRAILWNQVIRTHQRLTGRRGHLRSHLGVSGAGRDPIVPFSSEHASATIFFSLGHGVFFATALVWSVDRAALLGDLPWLMTAVLLVLASTFFELQPARHGLQQRSFAWVKAHAVQGKWPVFAMHFGLVLLIVGLVSPDPDVHADVAILFIGCRAVADLFMLAQRISPEWATPPAEPAPFDGPEGSAAQRRYMKQRVAYLLGKSDEEVEWGAHACSERQQG